MSVASAAESGSLVFVFVWRARVTLGGYEACIMCWRLVKKGADARARAGPTLAREYLRRPEITAARFKEWNGKRVYRTPS